MWEVGYKSVRRAEGAAAERKARAWCAGLCWAGSWAAESLAGWLHGAQLPPATVIRFHSSCEHWLLPPFSHLPVPAAPPMGRSEQLALAV